MFLLIACSLAKDSFAFLTRYLATFSDSGEDASSMNEAKEEAVQAVIDFVRSPDIVQVSHLSNFVHPLEFVYSV